MILYLTLISSLFFKVTASFCRSSSMSLLKLCRHWCVRWEISFTGRVDSLSSQSFSCVLNSENTETEKVCCWRCIHELLCYFIVSHRHPYMSVTTLLHLRRSAHFHWILLMIFTIFKWLMCWGADEHICSHSSSGSWPWMGEILQLKVQCKCVLFVFQIAAKTCEQNAPWKRKAAQYCQLYRQKTPISTLAHFDQCQISYLCCLQGHFMPFTRFRTKTSYC